jgi:hypothetical protein
MSTKEQSREKAPPTFVEIKAILDHLVLGKDANLKLLHGSRFNWTTKSELLDAVAKPDDTHEYRLIDPALIGNGQGRDTLIVRILTARVRLDGTEYPRMPYNGNSSGDYATDEQRARIAEWVDAGCPD